MDSITVNITDIIDSITVNITDIPDQIIVNISECLSHVYTDGITITGDGTPQNPLVSASSNNVGILIITANNNTTYQSNTLIGKSLLIVINDNVVRLPTDYTFNTTTGTITFISTIDVDVIIQILYV